MHKMDIRVKISQHVLNCQMKMMAIRTGVPIKRNPICCADLHREICRRDKEKGKRKKKQEEEELQPSKLSCAVSH